MSNPGDKSLGELIKEALKEKGLNQSHVAKKMNVSKQVINQIDRRKTFDAQFLFDLKKVTGLDFTDYAYPGLDRSISVANSVVDVQKSTDGDTKVNNDRTVEMSLSIKVKASKNDIVNMGELILSFQREAARLGFIIT